MVLVPVTVTDHDGRTVEGLRAEDFKILEDQSPQKIVSFAREDAPCSVGLVLDVSGSMRRYFGVVRDGAHAFLGTANRDDEFLLLTVSTQPEALSGFTNDIETLEQNIAFTRSGGMTALIDSVYLALNQMRRASHPQRALLVLSDGIDNQSRYSKSELMRVALEADVQVYTIIFNNSSAGTTSGSVPFRPSMIAKPGDRGAENQGPSLLEELSKKTGGLHFHVHSEAEVRDAALRSGQALRNEYVIGYQPSDAATPGKYHQVRVKSMVPKVNVYARNGYFSR